MTCRLAAPMVQHCLYGTAGSLHCQGRRASPLHERVLTPVASFGVAWLCTSGWDPALSLWAQGFSWRVFCSSLSVGYLVAVLFFDSRDLG